MIIHLSLYISICICCIYIYKSSISHFLVTGKNGVELCFFSGFQNAGQKLDQIGL